MVDSKGYGHTLFDPLGIVIYKGNILVTVSGGVELWERGATAPEVLASGNWPAGIDVNMGLEQSPAVIVQSLFTPNLY